MRLYRLPSGGTTTDLEEYAVAWTTFGDELVKLLPGYQTYGFDPGISRPKMWSKDTSERPSINAENWSAKPEGWKPPDIARMDIMSKEDIVEAAVKFIETSMKAVQSQYQRQPGPSSKRNLETSIDYHEAMAEMARAELQLHAQVWAYKEEQTKQKMRDAEEWKP